MTTGGLLGRFPQIIRFGIVGCAGFCVDLGVLYAALYLSPLGYYGARIVSYFAAASATWYLNRQFTFSEVRSQNRSHEWARFVVLNSLGGMINYLVYASCIHLYQSTRWAPAIGVALGSIAGMIVNFSVSRRFVFLGKKPSTMT